MNKANECTCPSGDGSLVHPCPAHPAVEQAGGDRWDALQSIMEWTAAKNIPDDRKLCLIRNAARAALAQPSPVRSSLLINGYQLRAALDFIAPDGTAEQLKSEACIEWRQQDADFLEAGLYAFCAEYPEEGGVLLDEEPTTAQPSPLQSEQAEAERPEVVARVVHSNPVVLGQCGPLNANDELMTVAQHAASVARWAEMFNRVEQQRDAALARVAELELGIARIAGDFLPDNCGQAELALDEMRQALHELLAAPPTQAQHSVPIAPELKRALGLVVAALEADGDRPTSKYALSELKKVLAAAPVCRLSRSALTDAQMRRLYDSSTETENERLGFAAFARLIRRAEAVHQIAAAPGKEGV
ncbi:hypothetical protein [Pseudomonas aeruginosa]|uniref:hypothetical protein n=1 Tax=Pseudomonas aeruginosa TaxID=287 RepID=UPI003FD303E6